jgi:hypothetical protein
LFVPLGAVWSLDRRQGLTPQGPSPRVLSFGTAGLLLQIALMYWTTALLKSGREWRVDGTAIAYALSIEELATPLGTALLQFPDLLEALTFLTLGLEIAAPLLLFSPVWSVPLRLAGIAAIAGLQAGIWLTLAVGIFPWLAAASMVCFLPSWFWDTLLPRLRARLTMWVGAGRWHWGVLAGSAGDAGVAPTGRLVGETPASPTVANRGAAESAASPTRASVALLNLAAGFCLVYVLAWNLASVSIVRLGADARAFGAMLGLVQSWTMFTPYPVDSTTWYAIPGTLRDGRQVALMPFLYHGDPDHLTPVGGEKPPDMAAAFARDERWRKYFESLHDPSNAHLLDPLADYLCREWNAIHGDTPSSLATLQIVHHWQRTRLDGQRAPVERDVQWDARCAVDGS